MTAPPAALPKGSRLVDRAVVAIVVAACAALVIGALYHTWLCYVAIPFWDQWDGVLYEPGGYTLEYLHSQHNEHRLLFPRLLFLLDVVAFDATTVFLIVSTLLIQALHALLLVSLVRRSGKPAGPWAVGVPAFALACAFAPRQIENFIWGFDIQFAMVVFFASATFASLAWSAEARRNSVARGWLAAAIGSATVATYSLASGILTWPLAVVLSLWLRLPWRRLLALAATGLAVCTLFLADWQPHPGHSDPWETIADWRSVLDYTKGYLGGPFADSPAGLAAWVGWSDPPARLDFARGVGAFGAWAALALALVATVRRRHFRPSEGALLTAMAFPVGGAFLTGLGRLRFPAEQALDSRYSTLALVFWACLVLTSMSATARASRRPAVTLGWLARASPAAICLALLVGQGPTLEFFVARAARQTEVALAVVAEVDDTERLKRLFPGPDDIWPVVEVLRRDRLSIFSRSWTHLVGRPLAEYRSRDPGTCSGGIDGFEVLASAHRPGFRLTGWAWDERRGAPPRRVVLVSEEGRIVGVGATGFPASGAAAGRSAGSDTAGWRGYAAGEPGGTLRAYAVSADGLSVCPLGQALATDLPAAAPI